MSTEILGSKFRLHIAYVKADSKLVSKIVTSLEQSGQYELTVTPVHNARKKGWKPAIDTLIAQADTILFVLSPMSAKSKIFAWEADRAVDWSKRVVSILGKPLGPASPPAKIADCRQLKFDQPAKIESGLQSLERALEVDADWLRMHSSLFVRAREWEDAGRPDELLLEESEIAAAKGWTFARPDNSPKPSELHMTFIQASEAIVSSGKAAVVAPREQSLLILPDQMTTNPLDKSSLYRSADEILKRQANVGTAEQETQRKIFGTNSHTVFHNEQTPPAKTSSNDDAPSLISKPRLDILHAALGGIFLAILAAGVWQVMTVLHKPREDIVTEVIQYPNGKETVTRLFASQNARLEVSLKQVECLIVAERDNTLVCHEAEN